MGITVGKGKVSTQEVKDKVFRGHTLLVRCVGDREAAKREAFQLDLGFLFRKGCKRLLFQKEKGKKHLNTSLERIERRGKCHLLPISEEGYIKIASD